MIRSPSCIMIASMQGDKIYMKSKAGIREEFYFYLFVIPWIIGFLIFTAYPILSSVFFSLSEYDGITPSKFVGTANYAALFKDELFYKSISTTFLYTAVSVPLTTLLSLLFALLLNSIVKLQNIFRTMLYFPSMVSGATMALLWTVIFRPSSGLIDSLLSVFGLKGPDWLINERTALLAIIIMSFWGVGGGMVIFLAGLKSVPAAYYEAAILDGAGSFKRFLHITMPLISPVVLFQVIMVIIDSFQVFTPAYVMTHGGPHYATWFYVYYLYRSAFMDSNIGYSSAMGWLLLIFVSVVSFYVIKTSSRIVYYEGGKD